MLDSTKSTDVQMNSSDVTSSDMFAPNEEKFWDAMNTVHIQVSKSEHVPSASVVDLEGQEAGGAEGAATVAAPHRHQQQDPASTVTGSRGIGGQENVKELLRDHLAESKRLFDILYFNESSGGRGLPLFEVIPTRCRSIPKEEILKESQGTDAGTSASGATPTATELDHNSNKGKDSSGGKERVIAKISDSQMQCIVCLKPTLLYPSRTDSDRAWNEVELVASDEEGNICSTIRNRKMLGNYKNTGFCNKHVYGTEAGSTQTWLDHQCKTVRGFNVRRKTGECKIRHLLCLELSGKGKVFLKWCTQCHLWKNFNEFYRDSNIDTFCDVCQQRQKESRQKQLIKRRNNRGKVPNANADKPAVEAVAQQAATIPFPNEGQKTNVVVDAAVVEVNAALTGSSPMETETIVPPMTHAGVENTNTNINTNGNGDVNVHVNGNTSIMDGPKTTEIQEIQEQQQQQQEQKEMGTDAVTAAAAPKDGEERPLPRGNQQDADPRYARQHRSAVIRKKRTEQEMSKDGPVDMAMELVEAKENQALNGHRKKKNKRRPACMDPEQADRLKNLQMSLLQQIPLVDFAFWHHNESDFVRALDSVVVDKKSLREYYFREDRLGDILFFSKDTLPRFAKESNPIPKRGMLPQLMSSDASKGIAYYPNMRISDSQDLCINSLKPLLMFPKSQQEQLSGSGSESEWRLEEPKVVACKCVRNTTDAKKQNENYKFTGFCPKCVRGEGDASQEKWVETGMLSIRGFNLGRKKVDHRLRHLLCLEDRDGGKVFLKWCTQCHTWKNFSSFLKQQTGPTGPIEKLNTFCAVCNRRQMVSRKMQSESRSVNQTQKVANASFRVAVTDIVDKSNEQPNQQKIVV